MMAGGLGGSWDGEIYFKHALRDCKPKGSILHYDTSQV